MPSPCSVPRALRLLIPEESPAQQAACRVHDEAYGRGGSRRDRAIADAMLLLMLLETGMDVERAHRYHQAVRMFGKPHWGPYTDDPEAAPPVPWLTTQQEAP